MTESGTRQSLNETLDRLWKQFLPQIEERVAVLDAAGAALAENRLSEADQEAAQTTAHKLAGVLGTFGLTKGTVLAREAEILYSGDIDPAATPKLIEIAKELRGLIANRA
jgi:HPt (histidine-containing phosphotransfer) domain-containing protein